MPVSEPSKYTTLWSQSGIRFDIPQAADPVTGKAGFDVGFSSINMTSEAAGGIPPWGQDFNGILYSLTKSAQYTQAGGIHTFDAALAAAVGGYAVNAMIKADSGLIFFINKIPGNASNPNSGGDGWIRFGPESYGSPMIGVPIPWPIEQMPQEIWPDCGMVFFGVGNSFDTGLYPKLAALYPSGVITDVRGKFIRAMDNGAGVDPGRVALSSQKGSIVLGETVDRVGSFSRMQNIKPTYFDQSSDPTQIAVSSAPGNINNTQPVSSDYIGTVRPANVAFYFIVRAA